MAAGERKWHQGGNGVGSRTGGRESRFGQLPGSVGLAASRLAAGLCCSRCFGLVTREGCDKWERLISDPVRGSLEWWAPSWVPRTHRGGAPGAPAAQAGVTPPPRCPRSQTYCIENAHGQLVRDLDFNPNKQYYLASCGDDCKVKFWDTRDVTEPVKTLEEHSHW